MWCVRRRRYYYYSMVREGEDDTMEKISIRRHEQTECEIVVVNMQERKGLGYK